MSTQGLAPLSKDFVDEHRENPLWETGNKTLYDLCERYPGHDQPAHIIAKIWLIGRAYGASIERRRKVGNSKEGEFGNDQFYETKVVSEIKGSDIDQHLKILRSTDVPTRQILEIHFRLMSIFKVISNLNKRSLASKYLHFHFPDHFFIYDSRATRAIKGIFRDAKKKYPKLPKQEKIDNEYEIFYQACKMLQGEIILHYNCKLSCREIDNLLLRWATEHGF